MSLMETLQSDNIAVSLSTYNIPVLSTHYDSMLALRHVVNELLLKAQHNKTLVDDAIGSCVYLNHTYDNDSNDDDDDDDDADDDDAHMTMFQRRRCLCGPLCALWLTLPKLLASRRLVQCYAASP